MPNGRRSYSIPDNTRIPVRLRNSIRALPLELQQIIRRYSYRIMNPQLQAQIQNAPNNLQARADQRANRRSVRNRIFRGQRGRVFNGPRIPPPNLLRR